MAIQPDPVTLSEDPAWQPWAEKGWSLAYGPTIGGRVQAVNHELGTATDGAKRLPTLIKRLEKGEQSHYWYTSWRQFTYQHTSQ